MKNIYKLLLTLTVIGGAYLIFYSTKLDTHSSEKLYSHHLELQKKYSTLSYAEILKLPKQDRPDLAALQHFEMTKDPSLGFPPIERKVEAYEKLLSKHESLDNAKTSSSDVEWVERGPNNVGGRTRALMFDPNDPTNKKVWAGGISGGLWVNQDITDASIGWTNINDFMASLSIATLTYDPNDKSTFYLGTGERYTFDFAGLGIWKSTDGGENWTRLSNTSGFSYVPKMVVTANSTIIAATANGIKRSIDGGDTWESPGTADVDMADVEIASNGDLFAGDFAGKVHKSTDDGVTWTSVKPSSGGSRVEIGISESSSDVIFAMAASGGNVAWLAKSSDGGTNWSDLDIPKYSSQDCSESSDDFTRGQAWYDLILGVHPTDASIVIVGGIDLHRSRDGGATWELISYWTGACDDYVHADQHAIVFRPENPDEGIFGNDGGVFYSADVGDATNPEFDARNKDYNVTQFYAAAAVNEVLSNEFLAGAQDNGTQRFLEPGVGSTNEATGGDGAYCHIDQDDANFQITSYVYSSYYLSTNHGNSFGTLNNDGSNTGRFINPTEYDSDANILYGAAGNNQIERIASITTSPTDMEILSANFGGNKITTIKASPYTDNRLFVGVQGSEANIIFRVDDAHDNPTVTNISGSFDATIGSWVSSIDVGASDDQLLVTFSNYGIHSIFESTDAGVNWSTKEGDLDDIPVYTGLYNPYDRSQVLIATELGVWSTEDITTASPTWTATNIGLANVSTRMLRFRDSDGLFIAATHGRGLYTTSSFNSNSIASMSFENKITYTGSEVEFINNSIGSVNNILWSFGDGYTSTENNPTHSFASPGTYFLTLEINNGQSIDQKEITILPSKPIPYLKANGGDFESNVDDFYIENLSGTPFERGKSDITGKDGTTSGDNAWVTGLTENPYQDNSQAYLYSPGYDFSSAGSYELSFETNYSFEPNWDGFIIEYSINEGITWLKLGDQVETGWYNQISDPAAIWGNQVPVFSGSTSGFEKKSKDVSFLAGNAKVGFRVHFGTDPATTDVGMAIDDFEVMGPSSVPVVDFLSSNPQICEGGSVVYNDNSTGTISEYNWNFGVGASPETASGSGPHTVIYATNGQYTTTLTVTGSSGDIVVAKSNYVNVLISEVIENALETNVSEFTNCDNFEGKITVKNSNTNVRYQAYDANNNAPLGQYKIGNGNDIALNIGELKETITTFVKTTNSSGCEGVLSTQPTFTYIGPYEKTVIADKASAICSGSFITFTIESSDIGVLYKIESLADGTELGSKAGDGNDLSIETIPINEALSVIVKAIHSASLCPINLTSEIEIEVNPLPDATITQTGSIMEVEAGAKSYQWYFQDEEIFDAVRNFHNPSKMGDYTVEITSTFDCISISEVFTTVVTGVDDWIKLSKVYPNPSNGVINVSTIPNSTIMVVDAKGEQVYRELSKGKQLLIDLSDFSQGIYHIIIEHDNGREVKKVLLE